MTARNGRPAAAGTIHRNATAGRPSRWLTALRGRLPASPGPAAVAAVRLIAVVGLGIDAYVHLDLASTYSEAQAPINEGILFRGSGAAGSCTGCWMARSSTRTQWARPCWKATRSTLAASASSRPAVMWGTVRLFEAQVQACAADRRPARRQAPLARPPRASLTSSASCSSTAAVPEQSGSLSDWS